MRIIHTSDWHIGRSFHNVSLLDEQRHVLNQIIHLAEHYNVDAIIIAGDVYDRAIPSAQAVELLDDVLTHLCGHLNIDVIIIPGNHDSAQRLGFGASQFKKSNLHIISKLSEITQPITLSSPQGLKVDIYAIPFTDVATVNHEYNLQLSDHDQAHSYLVDTIKSSYKPNNINILVSHCFLQGGLDSDSERPITIGGTQQVAIEPLLDFNYVALGHLHRPQSQRHPHIRYSGSILKYSFSEQHTKSITLVDFNESTPPTITQLALHPLRDVRVLEGELNQLVAQASNDEHSMDYLLVKLTNKEALLDAMGKLRSVYPNVLHLEKLGIMQNIKANEQLKQTLTRDQYSMFGDFYQQVMGQPMTDAQIDALKAVITELSKEEY